MAWTKRSASDFHSKIFSLVSGSFRANTPPPTRAPKDRRMGMTLVIPTNEAKIELPNIAANLQMAFKAPNAVALKETLRTGIKKTFTTLRARFTEWQISVRPQSKQSADRSGKFFGCHVRLKKMVLVPLFTTFFGH